MNKAHSVHNTVNFNPRLQHLVHVTNAELRRDNRYHCDCPACGKAAKPGQTHFSFTETGLGYCHVCGAKYNLITLERALGITADAPLPPVAPRPPQPPKHNRPPRWREKSADLLLDYCTHPASLAAWQRYKPLTRATIERFQLGYGTLPGQKTPRLILPVMQNGEMVGIRGRLPADYQKPVWMDDEPPKWINARGTSAQLYNADALQDAAGKIVAVCANNIDALLLMQEYPEIDGRELIAVSPTSGESTWREEWTQAIVAAQPHVVTLFYDHDDVGAEAAHRVERSLSQAGLYVLRWRWSEHAPPKADLGDLITAQLAQGQRPDTSPLMDFLRQAVYAAPRYVNERYSSDAMPPISTLPEVVTVRSAVGTGKTHWTRQAIPQADARRVLFITHRSSLNYNMRQRFSALGFVSHLDLDPKQYHHSPRMVITLNSLPRLAHEGKLPAYDLIVIDESDQVVKHLLGGTFKGRESQTTLSILDGLLSLAGRVICMDAHLSALTYRLLEPVTDRHRIHKVVNTYRRDDLAPVTFYDNQAKLQLELEADLAAGRRVFVVSNSRGKVEALAAKYRGQYNVFDIHSGNSQHADRQHFLNHVDEEVQNYDVIIASPSIASGIDIQTPFDRVYAFYDNHAAMTAEEMLQQIGRVRNVSDAICIYHPADPRNSNRITDAAQLETEAIATWNQHYALVEQDWSSGSLAELRPEKLTPLQRRHLQLWAMSNAKDNAQLIAPRATLAALLEDAGHVVTFDVDLEEKDKDDTTKAREKALRKENKTVRDTLKGDRKHRTLSAEPVTDEQYQVFVEKGTVTPDIDAGYRRWRIEQLYQQPVSDDLYDEYDKYGEAILELVNLSTDDKTLAARDRDDLDLAVSRQAYRLLRKRLILWLLARVFKPDQARGLDASWTTDIVFTERSLRQPDGFWESIMVHKVLIRNVLGLDPDNYTYATSFVGNLLKKLGLELKRHRVKYIKQRGKDKGKERSYSEYRLDPERLSQVNELLGQRAAAQGEAWDVSDVIIPSKKTRLILPESASKRGKQSRQGKA
jgi:hypothetical protein